MTFQTEENRIYAKNEAGELIAEVTFPQTGENTCTINHTFVDGSLRGQGIADKLVQAAVNEITSRGMEVQATCSYAAAWLEKQH